ncbi:ribosome-inactivating family protein [Streptomyces sp. CA-288835]|uniref:ribosome-inactivating family protein n=1 Tax=Streptomyces sp. CA-288835 TaxID=3240069 RepID=UPI003D8FEC4A
MSPDIVAGSPPGGRRTRTTIATAGAVLLALLLALLSPLGATKAFAIDDANDIDWDVSGGRASYQQMINDVRGRVNEKAIYGNGAQTVWATETTTDDFFLVNVYDGPNLLTRIVMNAHNLYVQGFYNPRDHTYRYTSDATLQNVNWLPSSSTEPNSAEVLPFSGSYTASNGLPGYAGQTRTTPMFSTRDLRDHANALNNPPVVENDRNAANRARAGALLWFVEAIAEGARFHAISDRIINGWTDDWGYRFDDSDVGLVTNWQVIGENLQRRLDGIGVEPAPRQGRYDFSTIASTVAVLALAMWWSPTS